MKPMNEKEELKEQQPSAPNLPEANGQRKDIRRMTYFFAISMVVIVFYGMLSLRPILVGNDMSRWATVWALTHNKGYVIDDAPYEGRDRVMRDGHIYSSKPALYPTITAGVTLLLRSATGWDLPNDERYIVRTVVFLFNVIPFFFVIILYGRILERLDCSKEVTLISLLTVTAGTYLTTYSVTLNNHTVGAWSFFFTVYCLIRIVYDGLTHWKYFLTSGLFAAWTVCNELPAGLFGLMVFIWLIYKYPQKTLRYFIPPAALILGAFAYTTYLSTGGLLPFYLRPEVYHYEGSYWNQPTGIDANGDSTSFYVFNMVLGHHGMFSLTPILFFAFVGLLTDSKFRLLHMMTLTLYTSVLIFLAVAKAPDYGGWCHGPRWTFWLIPGFLIALPYAIKKLVQKPFLRGLIYVALCVSIASVGLGWKAKKGPWENPWTKGLMRKLRLIDYN